MVAAESAWGEMAPWGSTVWEQNPLGAACVGEHRVPSPLSPR